LCTDAANAYFFNGDSVIAVNKISGEKQWASPKLEVMKNMTTNFGPSVLTYKNRVLFTGGENYKPHNGSRGKLVALNAHDGKILWESASPASGYQSPENMHVINGMVWQADTTAMSWNRTKDKSGKPFAATGNTSGTGLERGKEVVSFGPTEEAYWFHHRCYPAKATEDYLILSRTGVEFVDLKTQKWTLHHWVRGACLYGIMPANGLLYAPPHPCACYIGAKLYGFTALAAKNSANPVWKRTPEQNRLIKGSSAGQEYTDSKEKDIWPVYRQNNLRSGATESAVKTITKEKWQVKLGGNLTPPVAADNTLVIVQKNQATVNALDVASGEVKWRFTAGSRVDSAPTLYKKRCYFGCTDGYLYCLDLTSGKLIWKFQGAPSKAKHMYFEHIESTHPLHGSVLIQDDKIYAVAGRSMFIDGGMSFLILDAKTGKKLKEINMGEKVPGTDKQLQLQHEVLSMPQALNDILSSNGKQIHMRKQSFDLEGKRLDFKNSSGLYGKEKAELAKIFSKAAADQKGEEAHIISGTGFLDDSWWHRTYWSPAITRQATRHPPAVSLILMIKAFSALAE
jgi:outer membrane protein assembly factor BamB